LTIFDKLQNGLITDSAEETESIGVEISLALPENCALALQGDLGRGKTTLVRGIARGLGIKAEVTSPTYTIYTIHKGDRQLLHMDAYRLADAHELDSLAIDEFLESPYLVVVEWPDHIPGFFNEYPSYWIQLQLMPDQRHELKLTRFPTSGKA